LQGAEGKIATQQRTLHAAADGLADHEHLAHGDFQRIRAAPQVDAYGISHRNNVHANSIDNLSDLAVPGDDSDDLSGVAFHLLKRGDGDRRFLGLHLPLCYAASA
jgi:hypothetical protein